MHNPRNNRILASTALALILAIPLVSMAKNDSPIAAAPVPDGCRDTCRDTGRAGFAEAARATATEASEPPAISSGASHEPATSTEQAAQ